jgi:hypothetical protein
MSTILNKGMLPTIMAIAESTHYLVGAFDSADNFVGLSKVRDVEVLNSLADAKQYLRSHNIFTAALEFQSSYDEMCGTDTMGRYREIINL